MASSLKIIIIVLNACVNDGHEGLYYNAHVFFHSIIVGFRIVTVRVTMSLVESGAIKNSRMNTCYINSINHSFEQLEHAPKTNQYSVPPHTFCLSSWLNAESANSFQSFLTGASHQTSTIDSTFRPWYIDRTKSYTVVYLPCLYLPR